MYCSGPGREVGEDESVSYERRIKRKDVLECLQDDNMSFSFIR